MSCHVGLDWLVLESVESEWILFLWVELSNDTLILLGGTLIVSSSLLFQAALLLKLYLNPAQLGG